MSGLKGVVFDWGGTITPWNEVDLADLWSVAARMLAPNHEDALRDALVAVEREFWSQSASTGGNHSAHLHDLLQLATQRVGLDIEDAVRSSAVDAYLEAWTPNTFARTDAAEVMGQLRAMNLRIGLLSNTHWPSEWHERILRRDGILELIDERVYTSELAHTKPHKEAFSAILKRLGLKPNEAAMVGDRPIDDIAGCRAIGMRGILIPNDFVPKGDVEPDATITELSELPALLKSWM